MKSGSILHPISPIELAPGISMRFEVIPPVEIQKAALAEGKRLSFLMGSRGWEHDEEPRHRVIIPRPFYLGTFPVTQEEFACFRPEHRNYFHGKPRHPVENVSWDDAHAFLRWLNGNRKLPGGLKARLPCEAEWEYACRAGTDTEYYNGDGEGALRQVEWYGESWETGGTHAVGEKNEEHPWGLQDMHGNVWEWCADRFQKEGKNYAVVKGGTWFNERAMSRPTCYYYIYPHSKHFNNGFRLAKDITNP